MQLYLNIQMNQAPNPNHSLLNSDSSVVDLHAHFFYFLVERPKQCSGGPRALPTVQNQAGLWAGVSTVHTLQCQGFLTQFTVYCSEVSKYHRMCLRTCRAAYNDTRGTVLSVDQTGLSLCQTHVLSPLLSPQCQGKLVHVWSIVI